MITVYSTNDAGIIGSSYAKNKQTKNLPRDRSYTSHKLKVGHIPKCEAPSNEISDGNIKQNIPDLELAMSFKIQ